MRRLIVAILLLASPLAAQNTIIAGGSGSGAVSSVAGKTGAVMLEAADVTGVAPLDSPALTGTPTAPTAAGGTATTQIATTAFVGSSLTSALASYLTTATADATYLKLTGGTLSGPVTLPAGSAASPALVVGTGAGLYSPYANALAISLAGSLRFDLNTDGLNLTGIAVGLGIPLATQYRWGSYGGAYDTGLKRLAAGVLAPTDGSTGGGAINYAPRTAPAAPASGWTQYTDSADGKLKVIKSDGTIVTLTP